MSGEDEAPECNGVCLFAEDIGLPEFGHMLYAADPECELHGRNGS